MVLLWIATAALAAAPGCTSARLRDGIVNQSSTLTELQYRQVLDNIALLHTDPSALPSHVNLSDGSAQVADLGSASVLFDWHSAITAHPNLLGSRTVVQQWSMTPVTDETTLKILRLAYRRALGSSESLQNKDMDLANDLAHDLKQQNPDSDDFRGQVLQYLEDSRNSARYARAKQYRQAPTGKSTTLALANDPESLIDILLTPDRGPGRPGEGPRNPGEVDDRSPFRAFYEDSISSIDEEIVYREETIDRMDIYGLYPRQMPGAPPPDWIPDQRLTSRYSGQPIRFITPDAAEARRQVKEVQQDLLEIHPGWYGIGRKRDVPGDACYVGHHGDCYVWVCPEGRAELADFTLHILSFASLIKDTQVLTVPGPRYTPSSGFPSL